MFETSSELLADRTRLVRIRGELDLATAPELERALEPNGDGDGRIVVDLSECTFIDSTGLKILVDADRRCGHALLIVANGMAVRRTFELSGLDGHLRLHSSIESALTSSTSAEGKQPATGAMVRLLVEAPDADSALSLVDELEGLRCELLPGEDERCEVQVDLGNGRGQQVNPALDAVERWLTRTGIVATRVKLGDQTYVVERGSEALARSGVDGGRFATN